MRITTLSVLAALSACALTLGILHHLRARKEGEYWWLREQNNRMRYEAYKRAQKFMTISEHAAARTEASPPAVWSIPDSSTGAQYGYHNAGLGSPSASLQTFVWACDRVDTAMVAGMLTMEPGERRKVEAFLATQPGELRARWGSIENLAASLLILSSMANAFPSSEVLAASPVDMQGDDRAVCGAVRKAVFRRVGEQWKYELNAEQLEKLFGDITQLIAASPARQADRRR